jgi:uncharacterized protein (TIRG00374 family)
MLLARLTRRSTIFALLLTVILVAGVVRAATSFNLAEVAATLNRANPAWLLVALAASWSTFPLRGLRWRMILSASGLNISRRAATEILTLSFWVNCVLPAKMGDVYRGWLLKHNGATSFGNAVGTVIAERLVDLATVALLGAASTFVAFGGKLPPTALALTAIALGVAAATTLLLLVARGFAVLVHLTVLRYARTVRFVLRLATSHGKSCSNACMTSTLCGACVAEAASSLSP